MQFKVGDKVKTKTLKDFPLWSRKTGVINEVCPKDSEYDYSVTLTLGKGEFLSINLDGKEIEKA